MWWTADMYMRPIGRYVPISGNFNLQPDDFEGMAFVARILSRDCRNIKFYDYYLGQQVWPPPTQKCSCKLAYIDKDCALHGAVLHEEISGESGFAPIPQPRPSNEDDW